MKWSLGGPILIEEKVISISCLYVQAWILRQVMQHLNYLPGDHTISIQIIQLERPLHLVLWQTMKGNWQANYKVLHNKVSNYFIAFFNNNCTLDVGHLSSTYMYKPYISYVMLCDIHKD